MLNNVEDPGPHSSLPSSVSRGSPARPGPETGNETLLVLERGRSCCRGSSRESPRAERRHRRRPRPWRGPQPRPPRPTPTARDPPPTQAPPRGATATGTGTATATGAAAARRARPRPRSRRARTAGPVTSGAATSGSGGGPRPTTIATAAQVLTTATVRRQADLGSIRRAADRESLGRGSEAKMDIINETRASTKRRKRVSMLVVLSSCPSFLDATKKRKKGLKGVQSLVKR